MDGSLDSWPGLPKARPVLKLEAGFLPLRTFRPLALSYCKVKGQRSSERPLCLSDQYYKMKEKRA